MENQMGWMEDAMKGVAASGMNMSEEDKIKKKFMPTTDMGKFIQQCVKESMARHSGRENQVVGGGSIVCRG